MVVISLPIYMTSCEHFGSTSRGLSLVHMRAVRSDGGRVCSDLRTMLRRWKRATLVLSAAVVVLYSVTALIGIAVIGGRFPRTCCPQ